MENKNAQYVKEAMAILEISKDNPLFAKNQKALIKLKLDIVKSLVKEGYGVKLAGE